MRVIITARQSLTPSYEGILNRLVNIMGEISKNPSNPKFNQYCFESVSALIRLVISCNTELSLMKQICLRRDTVRFTDF